MRSEAPDRFDAFLDLEGFAGVKLCEQRLELLQERLSLFGGQFVAVDFQSERLTKDTDSLYPIQLRSDALEFAGWLQTAKPKADISHGG